MAYLNSNNYLLNIVPLFNVANSGAGSISDVGTLSSNLETVQGMVDTTTNTLSANAIQPFTAGGNVVMSGDFQILGSLTVNDTVVGSITGEQSFLGTSFTAGATSNQTTSNSLLITTSNILFEIQNTEVFALDSIGHTWISSCTVGGTPTSPPSSLLTVYGDTYTDRLFVSSTVTCGSVIQFSDARYKEHIVPIVGALSSLQQLRGVHYIQGGIPAYGFLAQEVQVPFPECVDTQNPLRYGVDYSQLIPILTEAIKQLTERIEALEKRPS